MTLRQINNEVMLSMGWTPADVEAATRTASMNFPDAPVDRELSLTPEEIACLKEQMRAWMEKIRRMPPHEKIALAMEMAVITQKRAAQN